MASILYLSYDGLTGQIGQSQILPYLRKLARRGHAISALSFESGNDADLAQAVAADLEYCGIAWHPRRFRSHPPIVAKIVDQFDAARTARRLARNSRFDVVHCRSYVAADAGLKLKRRFGTKLLFDMRGFWVDERVEGGRWPQSNPFFRFVYRHWKAKEASLVAEADEIVVLAEAAREAIAGMPVFRGCPVSVIPCSLDFDRFFLADADQRAKARRDLQIEDGSTVLAYLGSLGTVYRFEEMVCFFRALRERSEKAVFFLIGQHDPQRILALARQVDPELDETHFRFTRSPHADVPYWLGAGDLAIGFRSPTYSGKGASPTKLGEYLAAGLPVVCNDGVGDVGHIVEILDAGCVVEDLSRRSIEEAAVRIGDYLGRPRQALRQRSRQVYDIDSAVQVYDDIYSRMTA